MGNSVFFQLVYVGDLHLSSAGPRKFLNLFMLILLYEAVGTPFAYNKFAGGLSVEFVGFFLDYDKMRVGVTVKRGDWLVEFLRDFRTYKRLHPVDETFR